MTFAVGTKVKIVKNVRWGRKAAMCARPTVGLVGKVANPAKYPYTKPPARQTAVLLKATDLGYFPHDDDHKYMVYCIPTHCLERV